MEILKLAAEKREETGKGPARRLRQQGLFPGVVYGGDKKPQKISLNSHDFKVLLNKGGENVLINLAVAGKKGEQSVIVRDLQLHPITHNFIHADLLRVRLDEKLEYDVQISPVGQAQGVKDGGILETILHEIRLFCLPTEVPDEIEVDVTNLEIRDTIHVSDLKVPEGVEILEDPEEAVLTVVPPRLEEAAEEEEAVPVAGAEEAEEPEVIGRKKEEDEEEAGKKEE